MKAFRSTKLQFSTEEIKKMWKTGNITQFSLTENTPKIEFGGFWYDVSIYNEFGCLTLPQTKRFFIDLIDRD